MIAFLRRLFHRHRWTLHSFAVTQNIFGIPFEGSACLECVCGERRHVERGSFGSRDEALVWLRSQCSSQVPSSLPEQIDVPAAGGRL